MPNKMERFSSRARRVLAIAQEQAERLQHNYIGTEHLLLGLMGEEGGIAGRVLRDLGLDPRRVQELVVQLTRAGERNPNTRLDLSPGVKKVLELAVDESRRMGHHYIGTEHLLLGLVRQSDSIAVDVLKRRNVSPEEVRRQVRRLLQEAPIGSTTQSVNQSTPESPLSFSKQAEIALMLAREESGKRHDSYIGTEHLLLALLCDANSIAGRVLLKLTTLEAVDKLVAERTSNLPKRESDEKVELSSDFQKVIELAAEETRRIGHNAISTEELLMGFTQVTTGVGMEIIKALNLDPEKIRRHIIQFRSIHIYPSPERPLYTHKQQAATSSPPRSSVSSRSELLIDQLTYDLLQEAKDGKLDPVIGRDVEIEHLIVVLGRLNNANVALIGETGVGKTSIVEGLALRMSSGTVPPNLLNKPFRQLDPSALIVMTRQSNIKADYDPLLRQLFVELSHTPNILYLNDLLKFVTGTRARYELNLELLVKAYSDIHRVTFIAEMSEADYEDWQHTDPGLARRFQPIYVKQPSIEETIAMLQGCKKSYETHHQIEISDEAIEAVARLSAERMQNRALPGKAFDLLDTASSRLRAAHAPAPETETGEPKPLRLTAEHIAETIAEWNDPPTSAKPLDKQP